MSAYVVDNETINLIVAAIQESKHKHTLSYPGVYNDILTEPEPAALGQSLYDMNVEAVRQRYPDCENLPGTYEDDTLVPYLYEYELLVSPIEVYKRLECYLYQCSEGDVPDWTLYQALAEYKSDLASRIISNLPEYKQLSWR